jgi:hypothetical protein
VEAGKSSRFPVSVRTATAIAFLVDMETVHGGRTTEVINPWPP